MIIFTFIDSTFQELSPLQKVRTRGVLRALIDELNEKTLTMPSQV